MNKMYTEVLMFRSKGKLKMQINERMLLDEKDPVNDAASMVDWDGQEWKRDRVFAVLVFDEQNEFVGSLDRNNLPS